MFWFPLNHRLTCNRCHANVDVDDQQTTLTSLAGKMFQVNRICKLISFRNIKYNQYFKKNLLKDTLLTTIHNKYHTFFLLQNVDYIILKKMKLSE